MILGAAYNAFDAWELLPHSVKSIRKYVDWIGVVIQDYSNFGNELTPEQYKNREDTLNLLLDTRQIDAIIPYKPEVLKGPHENEVRKRNLGLRHAELFGCTHFLTIDCDEIYLPWQFKFAKEQISEKGYKVTACQMKTYYKRFDTAITPDETYYVPFIFEIKNGFKKGVSWPVQADPTRKVPADKVYLFNRTILEMQHLSYVRNDIRLKLENSSAKQNFSKNIEFLVEAFEDFKEPGETCYLAGSEPRAYKTIKVDNILEKI
jgi:hypothetical protein